MGLRKRKTAEEAPLTADVHDDLNEKAQEVMKDNMEMMLDIVMRIREDPEFASGIYKDCPRLQHLLYQYPDLRPVFEDPKLVKINFESVYRAAGGVLPEDEVKKKGCWDWFVNSPFFKVIKFLLFIKKVMACIAGGGFAVVSGAFMGCCFEDALEHVEDGDGDVDDDGDEYEGMDENKKSLNLAADHMEDPEVQENMQRLLDDPDNLAENIENDPELSALRDSNPLCEELMQDPERMKVLVDPDNLRALGECPEMIEADFADPGGFDGGDLELQQMEGMEGGYDNWDGAGGDFDDFEIDVDEDVDGADEGVDGGDEDGGDGEDGDDEEEEEEEEENWFDDAELEEQEPDDMDNDNPNRGSRGQQKGKAQGRSARNQQQGNPENPKSNKFSGILASIGAAATDLIAAQIVGSVMGDFDLEEIGGGDGGGGGDLGDLDSPAAPEIGDTAEAAGEAVDDDVQGVVEDTVDEADERKEGEEEDEDEGKKKKDGAAGAAAGGAVGGAAGAGAAGDDNDKKDKKKKKKLREVEEGEDGEEDGKESKTKKRLGGLLDKAKDIASATATGFKETVAGAVLGDDWGAELVERMEEGGESDEDDEEEDDDSKKEGDEDDTDEKKKDKDEEKKKKKKKKKFFGRSKKD